MPPKQPDAPQPTDNRRDALGLAGFASMAAGLWMLSPAWCLVICGGLIFGLCLWSTWDGTKCREIGCTG